MVSKEEEQEARLLCSYCNFCSDCKECSHRQFPNLQWISEPHFNIKECSEWELYLDNYGKRLKYRLRDYKLKLIEYINKIIGWLSKCLRWMSI